jgi:hypothetical protein
VDAEAPLRERREVAGAGGPAGGAGTSEEEEVMTEGQWFTCGNCGAYHLGGPPHGGDVSCPLAVAVNEATVAMLDAQRMSYIRNGSANADIVTMMRKITGLAEDDG